jgi:hypothetical protein
MQVLISVLYFAVDQYFRDKIVSHEGSNNMMGGLLREARVVLCTSTGLGFIPGVYKSNYSTGLNRKYVTTQFF